LPFGTIRVKSSNAMTIISVSELDNPPYLRGGLSDGRVGQFGVSTCTRDFVFGNPLRNGMRALASQAEKQGSHVKVMAHLKWMG
jgi:hypothetical protein